MTKQQFIDYDHSIGDLIEICNEHGWNCCCDVLDNTEYDEHINNEMSDGWLRYEDWEYVRDYLNQLPTGYDWYIYNDWDNEYRVLGDDDIQDIKDEILELMDDRGMFDDAVDDEEDNTMEDTTDSVASGNPDEIDILEDELMGILATSA